MPGIRAPLVQAPVFESRDTISISEPADDARVHRRVFNEKVGMFVRIDADSPDDGLSCIKVLHDTRLVELPDVNIPHVSETVQRPHAFHFVQAQPCLQLRIN